MNSLNSNGHAVMSPKVLPGNGFGSSVVLETDRAVAPSDGNDRVFPRDPAKYGDDYWELGWTDGRLGQPFEEGEAAVEWRAKVARNAKLADLRAQIAVAATKIASLNERIGSLPQQLAELREYQHELRTAKFKENFHASVPVGVLYTIVGFVLFIADLPLSLKLVTQALNIPRQVGAVSVDQLFSSPFKVIFGPTWEAIFLAAGIAFSGMFVKYFLDEVIFPQKFAGDPNAESSSPRPAENRRTRQIVFSIIFLLFISTTIVLGIFRASAQGNKSPDRTSATQSVRSNSVGGASRGGAVPVSQPSNSFTSVLTLESVTFTLLTLMFPIIGGVCFSAGSRRLADGCRRLKRTLHYWRVMVSTFWMERKYRPLQRILSDLEVELSRLQQLLKQEQDDALDDASTQLNLNIYKHGYLRGSTLPETLHVSDRLYPHAKRVVEKFLARDLRTQLWEDFKTKS